MSDSNSLQLLKVRETTLGTTPGSPDMTQCRVTGETLNLNINTIRSEEIRPDRLTPDLVQTSQQVSGGFNFELSYGAFDEEIESVMCNSFTEMPVILNTASDTEITDVVNSSDTFAVASGGGDFKAGHLVQTSGFTNANNSGIFKVASSTATTIVAAGTPTLTDESAPPAGAQIKVVGFQGTSGDIQTNSNGLISSSLDFTTLGLTVGQWIKVGGTATADKFATAACNDFIRISSIAANALVCDNLPASWGVDNGSGKTIKVWVGDFIRTGSAKKGITYEKVLTTQDTPYYQAFNGCMINQMNLNFAASAILSGSVDVLGFNQTGSLSSLDAAPATAPQNDVLNAVANVGRIALGGSVIAGPNYIQSATLNISNNLRPQNAIGSQGLIGIGLGDSVVSGTLGTYFGDKTLLEKFINDEASSVNMRVAKAGKAMIFDLPSLKFTTGASPAAGRNQDVLAELGYTAKVYTDGTSAQYQFQIDRFDYYEA